MREWEGCCCQALLTCEAYDSARETGREKRQEYQKCREKREKRRRGKAGETIRRRDGKRKARGQGSTHWAPHPAQKERQITNVENRRDLATHIKDRMALPASPHPSVLPTVVFGTRTSASFRRSSTFLFPGFSLCVLSLVFVPFIAVAACDLVSRGTGKEARESFSSRAWKQRDEEQRKEKLSDQSSGLHRSSSSSWLAARDDQDSLTIRPWLRGDHKERKDKGPQMGRERTITSRNHHLGSYGSRSSKDNPDSDRYLPRNSKRQLDYGTSGGQSSHDQQRKGSKRGDRSQNEAGASEQRAEGVESTGDGSRRQARQETTETPQGDTADHPAVKEDRIRENREGAAEEVVNPDKDVNMDELIHGIAEALRYSGLQEAGYSYVMLDDCWGVQQQDREATEPLHWDSFRFPSGMPALASFLHQKGFKFGMYTDGGTRTCMGYPGSKDHEDEDAAAFQMWGVDFLKIDGCWADPGQMRELYGRWSPAFEKAAAAAPPDFKQKVVLNCSWPAYVQDPAHFDFDVIQSMCDMWRIYDDIEANWQSLVRILSFWGDNQEIFSRVIAPGSFNDPDMLEIGNGQLTYAEGRTQMSIWSIITAPLILGNDVRMMPIETLQILSNPDVIAVNQDDFIVEGLRIFERPGLVSLWMRPLSSGSAAAAIINLSPQSLRIAVEIPVLQRAYWEAWLPLRREKIRRFQEEFPHRQDLHHLKHFPSLRAQSETNRKADSVGCDVRDLWLRVDLGFMEHALVSPHLLEPHDTFLVSLKGCRPISHAEAARRDDTPTEDNTATGKNKDTRERLFYQGAVDGFQSGTLSYSREQDDEARDQFQEGTEQSGEDNMWYRVPGKKVSRGGTSEEPYLQDVGKKTPEEDRGRGGLGGKRERDRQMINLTLKQRKGENGDIWLSITEEKRVEKDGQRYSPLDSYPLSPSISSLATLSVDLRDKKATITPGAAMRDNFTREM
ncbi:melibiase subfamily protein [Cystoisospora suis]|uniref:Alpha-galactosidase n=1 Tax=Cystoisospora suis TaxID=483139 RepID=A0A2C6KWQ6_9APIC|nr:melibiase subfamily protein [Cystoisospora suis]